MPTKTFGEALAELATAQKSKRGVSLYSRIVNRPIGRVFAATCYMLGMSPNQVTAASAAVTGAGLLLLVTVEPSVPGGITVAALLVIGFALDSADGQVARLTGRGSLAGEWLDHVVDAAKIVAVHGAVLVSILRFFDVPVAWIAVPLGFQVVNILVFFGGELQRLLLLTREGTSRPPGPPSALRAVALLPADYGILALSFVLLGTPVIFLGAYSVLLAANIVIMALLLRKWFKALGSTGA